MKDKVATYYPTIFAIFPLNKLVRRTMGHRLFCAALGEFFDDCASNGFIPDPVLEFNASKFMRGGYVRHRTRALVLPETKQFLSQSISENDAQNIVDRFVGALHQSGSYVNLWPAGASLKLAGECFDLDEPIPNLVKNSTAGSTRKETAGYYKIVNGRVFFNIGTDERPDWRFRRRANKTDMKTLPVLDGV